MRSGAPFGGVLRDIRLRGPLYLSDLRDALTPKTLSAALYMFFATFASTVALGELARQQTDGRVGVTEYLLLQVGRQAPQRGAGMEHQFPLFPMPIPAPCPCTKAGCGVVHSLFSSQPLLILRPTGPITVFMAELYTLSGRFHFDYFEWLAWVGIFVGLYLLVICAFDGSYYIRHMTRFLHDLYAAFVCTIYAVDGIQGVYSHFQSHRLATHIENYASALYQLILAAFVVLVALFLHRFETYTSLTRTIRRVLADYALSVAIFIAVGIRWAREEGERGEKG